MLITVPKTVELIINQIENAGYEAFLVGGCVRDIFLGKEPLDWDITTSAHPEKVIEIFSNYKIVPTGLKHGTVGVIINQTAYEITTYRTENGYSDNRHPDIVEYSTSIKDDLSRRDFSMNAIAYNPKIGIYDPFDGISDIKNKIIRTIGNPDIRFGEDALRILRGLRFAAILGFDIELKTAKSIIENKELLRKISKERIASEFNKLICGDYAERILAEYRDVFSVFIPEIASTFNFCQHNPHHCFDVWRHSLVALKNIEKDKTLRLAIFFHDIGKPYTFKLDQNGIGHFKTHNIKGTEITRSVLKRLKYDRKTILDVTWLVYHHDQKLQTDRASVKHYINIYGAEMLKMLMKVQLADNSAKKEKRSKRYTDAELILKTTDDILSKNECCTMSQLNINGNDILSLGIRSGEKIGEILNNLLELVINEKCKNEKNELIKEIEKLIKI